MIDYGEKDVLARIAGIFPIPSTGGGGGGWFLPPANQNRRAKQDQIRKRLFTLPGCVCNIADPCLRLSF
jgi:hypothetical protein